MSTSAPRIVSLVPSVTETLLAWGVAPVACTRFCEQPGLRHVGGTKDPDVVGITELAPDLVVVDAEENRREDFDALVAAGLRVHALHVTSVDTALAQLGELAAELGVAWSPALPEPADTDTLRSVFVPIWRRPWMALGGGTFADDLLRRLGLVNVFAPDGRYPTVTLEDAHCRRPELVLAASEPYPFAERHRAELETVAPVEFVDGQDLFWWGARTPGALTRLSRQLAAR
jgi:ABC-type hemin transport system substrate-binding protein